MNGRVWFSCWDIAITEVHRKLKCQQQETISKLIKGRFPKVVFEYTKEKLYAINTILIL